MNVALILAGGLDFGFQMDVPKQFVNVFNRPLIVYTLERFQNHPEIDAIAVACLQGWQEMVKAYAKQFNITKLKWVVPGGKDGQETSFKGLLAVKSECREDDIIILHDAIRPMVSSEIIADSIRTCRQHGMGVAAVCSRDAIIKSKDGKIGDESISRYEVMRVQTPQAYRVGLLEETHRKAKECGIEGQWEISTLMSMLGQKIYFSSGSDMNMKINTLEDVTMFKALYQMKKDKENE